jgi:hypothetical protein
VVSDVHAANADYIVRAVNNHAKLISVCKLALSDLYSFRQYGDVIAIEELEEAIEQAESPA